MSRRRAPVAAFVAVAGAVAAAFVLTRPAASTPAPALPLTGRENVVYLYNPVSEYTKAQLATTLRGARYVVVGDQAEETSPGYWHAEATAARRIRATGAVPLHYVDYVSLPERGMRFGIDLAAHPAWRFCGAGATPATPSFDGPSGYVYLDLGRPAAMAAAQSYLDHLAAAGYAGIHLDGGDRVWIDGAPSHLSATAAPSQLADRRSSCGTPSEATLGDAQARLMAWAHAAGPHRLPLFTVLNCCLPSQFAASRIDGAALADRSADRLMTEQVKAALVPWGSLVVTEGVQAQRTGRIWNFQCARPPAGALYAWARAKLWPQVVVVNAGEGATHGSCATADNKWGVHPELTDARLGTPLDASYLSTACTAAPSAQCVLVRRYTNGAVVVSLRRSATRVTLVPRRSAGCVYAARLRVSRGDSPGSRPAPPAPLAGDGCVPRLTVPVPARGAVVLLYRTTPW